MPNGEATVLLAKIKSDFINKSSSEKDKIERITFVQNLESMPLVEAEKLTKIVIDDLNSYEAYLEMDEITSLIDRYFNSVNNISISFEGIQDRIQKLPSYNLIHFKSDDLEEIYNNYSEKLYEFILYSSVAKRFELLKNPNVRDIVAKEVRKDVNKLKGKQGLTETLDNYVNNLKKEDPDSKYLNHKLLQELCAEKGELIIGDLSEIIQTKKDAKKDIKGHIIANKSALRKLVAKIALYLMIASPFAVGPIFLSTKAVVEENSIDGFETLDYEDIATIGALTGVTMIGEASLLFLIQWIIASAIIRKNGYSTTGREGFIDNYLYDLDTLFVDFKEGSKEKKKTIIQLKNLLIEIHDLQLKQIAHETLNSINKKPNVEEELDRLKTMRV